jgi:hypothetical protein
MGKEAPASENFKLFFKGADMGAKRSFRKGATNFDRYFLFSDRMPLNQHVEGQQKMFTEQKYLHRSKEREILKPFGLAEVTV